MEEENKTELGQEDIVQETTSQVDTPVVQPETPVVPTVEETPVVPTTEEKPVEQPNTPQTEETAKKGLLNNKKQVTGKKLSVWVVVMILIFMIFTFGLGVYFGKEIFTDKKKSNKGTNTEQTTNTETNTDIDNDKGEQVDLAIGEELIETLLGYSYLDGEDNDYSLKKMITYTNDKVVKASDLNHFLVYQVILNKFYSMPYPNEISVEDIKSNVSKVFDSSYKYVAKDYFGNCGDYSYKLNNDKYVKTPKSGGCGGTGFILIPYKVVDAYLKNDKLSVEVKVLFGEYVDTDNSTVKYYEDYNKTKLIDGANHDNYDDYINNGSSYIFTFTKSNDNYLFVKSEMMK